METSELSSHLSNSSKSKTQPEFDVLLANDADAWKEYFDFQNVIENFVIIQQIRKRGFIEDPSAQDSSATQQHSLSPSDSPLRASQLSLSSTASRGSTASSFEGSVREEDEAEGPVDQADERLSGEGLRGLLVVETSNPFRIESADAQWLDLLGFARREIVGRSIRLCVGPLTDLESLINLLRVGAQGLSAKRSLTLYKKNGDELSVTVRSSPSPQGPECATLEVSMPPRLSEPTTVNPIHPMECKDAMLFLSPNDPFSVQTATLPFLSLYGVTRPQLLSQGINIVRGSNEKILPWHSLLKKVVDKLETKACVVSTFSTEGRTFPTLVRITPSQDRDQIVVAFYPIDELEVGAIQQLLNETSSPELVRSPASSQASSSASSSPQETSPNTSQSGQVSESQNLINQAEERKQRERAQGLSEAVWAHMKAMRQRHKNKGAEGPKAQ